MYKIWDGDNILGGGHPVTPLMRKIDPLERHENNISARPGQESGRSNPDNLFDDLNSEDRKWLKVAREHLKKRANLRCCPRYY